MIPCFVLFTFIFGLITLFAANFAKKLLHFDGSTGQFRTIQLRKRRTDCEVCGENPVICELIDYENFCQAGACDKV